MKAALCAIASKYVHFALAPRCLRAGVQQYAPGRHQVLVFDHTVNAPVEQLAHRLAGAAPQFVGLGVYIWNRRQTEHLVRLLRRVLPGCVIALGGPEVSFCPAETLAALPEADYVLCGEGERALPLLLNALEDGAPLDGVPGLCRRQGTALLQNPAEAVPFPLPDPWAAPGALDELAGRMAYVETSRGCPFDCAFCLSGRRDPVRLTPVPQSLDLLLRVGAGGGTVKLVDRTFNCDPRRAEAIWRGLGQAARQGRLPAGVCFHFEIGADLLDAGGLEALAQAPAGLFRLEAGVQSFYPPALEAVSRRTDMDKLCRSVRAVLAPGNLRLHLDLIAGLPGEGLEQFSASFNSAFALRPHELQLGFLKLLYGSRLRRQADALGILYDPEPPYEVLSTPDLSYADLQLLQQAAQALERLYNSGGFPRTLEEGIRCSGGGAFAFFAAFGARMAGQEGALSEDSLTALLLEHCAALPGADPLRLRTLMAADLLARGAAHLPPALHAPAPWLRGLLHRASALACCAGLDWAGALEHGALRAAPLPGGTGLLAADARRADPVTGRLPVRRLYRTDGARIKWEQDGLSPADWLRAAVVCDTI